MSTIEQAIETMESYAEQIEGEALAERAHLLRMIRAEARILAVQAPRYLQPQACEWGDEAGHCGSYYPPEMEYRDRTGPALYTIREWEHEEVPTSSGYYYSWRAVPSSPGLYVDRDGRIRGGYATGGGRVGQFAARPGDCDVRLTIKWAPRPDDTVSIAELREIEADLRARAGTRATAEV